MLRTPARPRTAKGILNGTDRAIRRMSSLNGILLRAEEEEEWGEEEEEWEEEEGEEEEEEWEEE